MGDWLNLLFNSDVGVLSSGPETVLFVLSLAFGLGQVVGWVYMRTHQGMSYSQVFVASLAVLPVLVALMMILMSGSLMLTFGFLAVFAVVRFRNVLKDTRDTAFILWSLVEGMAVGTMRHSTALIGGVFIGTIFLYLRATEFGSRQRYDAVLNLQWTGASQNGRMATLTHILHDHCARVQITNERKLKGDELALAYRVLLRDPSRSNELESALQKIDGVKDVSLFLRQDESEV